jgi:hypothetical protein
MFAGFWWDILIERGPLDYVGVNGKLKLKLYLYEIERASVDWIHLTQDKEQCWVLVNMVMKVQICGPTGRLLAVSCVGLWGCLGLYQRIRK